MKTARKFPSVIIGIHILQISHLWTQVKFPHIRLWSVKLNYLNTRSSYVMFKVHLHWEFLERDSRPRLENSVQRAPVTLQWLKILLIQYTESVHESRDSKSRLTSCLLIKTSLSSSVDPFNVRHGVVCANAGPKPHGQKPQGIFFFLILLLTPYWNFEICWFHRKDLVQIYQNILYFKLWLSCFGL